MTDPCIEIPEILSKTVLQTQKKVEGLILAGHGTKDSIQFPLGSYELEDLHVEKWEEFLEAKCPLVLISCEVGKNLAGELAQKLQRFVFAPISLCFANNVDIIFRRELGTICMEATENNIRLFPPEGGSALLKKDSLIREAHHRLEKAPHSSDLFYLANYYLLGKHSSKYKEQVPTLYRKMGQLCKEQESICIQDSTFPKPEKVPYKEILDVLISLSTETEQLYKWVLEKIFSAPIISFWFYLSTMLEWANREDLAQICAYLGCKVREHKGL